MKRSPIGFFNGTYYKKETDLFDGVMYEERIFISPKKFEEIVKNENDECLIMYEGKERKGEIICQSGYCNKYIIGIIKE
jgi:uncharacterized beta-barrel protein YwiB (DUF1934 family)